MEEKLKLESWENTAPKIETPCGNLYLVQCFSDDKPDKVFIYGPGKPGGCQTAMLTAIQKLIGRALKNGATYEDIAEDLDKIHCSNPTFERGKKYESCLELIASHYKEEEAKEEKQHGS